LPSNLTFTHLINPFRSAPGSEYDVTSRLTFASIRTAMAYAKTRGVDVDLISVCYPEDLPAVEPPSRPFPVLNRSVQDFKTLNPVKKFPLVGDLVKAAGEHGTGDYIVFTNIDIILQPFFYSHVADLLRRIGKYAPAFVINRRIVSMGVTDPLGLPGLYAEDGRPHLGYDCFVFPRAWAAKIDTGSLCIGTNLFDSVLFALLDQQSGYKMRCFARQRLTLHMGDDQKYLKEYMEYNRLESIRVMAEARAKADRPIPPWSAFAWRELLVNNGVFVGSPVPLHHKIAWRLIEEMSLRKTRRLLRDYLKTLPKP
jgi:hypothetical protein